MTPYDSVERLQLEARLKSGANWFYWIAALSLVTSIISLAGGTWGFFISLGITQFIDGLALSAAEQLGWGFKAVAFVFDVVAAGLFALFGFFAAKRHPWAFLVGMGFYALDGLLFILAAHWLGLLFHAFALYSMYGGYKASAALVKLDQQAPPPPWREEGSRQTVVSSQ